jgi:hypothetical protein
VTAERPFPVLSNKLDDRLAFVRQEAQRITDVALDGDVAVLDAALRIEYTLQGTHWTQRRYPHFTLSQSELEAIHRFVDEGWRMSGEQTTTEIRKAATALLTVGLD